MWQQLEAETTPVAVLHALWMGAAEGFLEGEPLLQRLRGGGRGVGVLVLLWRGRITHHVLILAVE